jgi:hypothetical protein
MQRFSVLWMLVPLLILVAFFPAPEPGIASGVQKATSLAVGVTPVTGGTPGDCLIPAGGNILGQQACGLAFLTVGNTDIQAGTNGYVEYDNGGVLGEFGLGTNVRTWLTTPSWTNFESAITGTTPYAQTANNLSDLASESTARTNLGLGALATVTPGTGVATAAGNALGSSAGLAETLIANGTIALATNAISSGACQAVSAGTTNSAAATTVATTDIIEWTPNGSIKAVTGFVPGTSGGLSIVAYPTSGYVNWDVCNWSGSSITPGAVTLNYRVTR